jgi:hypothetical protein
MFSWPYSKSYIWSSIILWALFLMALMAVVYGRSVGWPVTVLWSLALVPALTVLIQAILAYRLVSHQDEFIRGLTARRMVVALGLTLVVVAAWSPLEEFFGLPHVPMWLIYPLFWGLFGVVSPFIRGSVA